MAERLLTHEELNQIMLNTLRLIGGEEKLLPKINVSNGLAYPYIEIGRYGYEYVCNERGMELFRKLPVDLNELLYLVFEKITSEMAIRYEAKNRNYIEDNRRMMFSKQIDLLRILSNTWAERRNAEHLQILKSHPFRDDMWIDFPKQ